MTVRSAVRGSVRTDQDTGGGRRRRNSVSANSSRNSSRPTARTRSNPSSGNPWRAVPSRLSRCFTGPERVISKSYSPQGVPPMPTPNLPSGFDFTDPDIHAERLPVEELAELRRTAPIWWNEQPVGAGGFDDGGFWVVSKHKDVKEISRAQRRLLQPGEDRAAALQRRHGRRADRTRQVRPAQHGRPAAHPSAQDHLARLHAPGRRAAARRPPRAGPPDRGNRGGAGIRRLRRTGVVRASAAGHRRSAGRAAGRPDEAVPLVQPDGRRPGSRVRRTTTRSAPRSN